MRSIFNAFRFGRLPVAAMCIMFAATNVAAEGEQGSLKTASVPFKSTFESGPDGYVRASVNVSYRLINCGGEIHIAYSLDPKSVTTGTTYIKDHAVIAVDGSPPEVPTVHFYGFISDGPVALGQVDDKAAGPSLGFGCFTGQTQKVANLKDKLPGSPTPTQIAAYLDRFYVKPGTTETVLRNGSLSNKKLAASSTVDGNPSPISGQSPNVSRMARDTVDTIESSPPKNDISGSDSTPSGNTGYFFCQLGPYITSLQKIDINYAFTLGTKLQQDKELMSTVDSRLGNYMLKQNEAERWMAYVYQMQLLDSPGVTSADINLTTCQLEFFSWSLVYKKAKQNLESIGRGPQIMDWQNPSGSYALKMR